MPTSTYVALATTTLASASSSVTFSSIPATYRDLVIVFDGQITNTDRSACVRFNGDTGSNYSRVSVSNTASGTISNTAFDFFYQADANRASAIINIMDYSATDKHKSAITRSNDPTSYVFMYAQRWASTDAITSITLLPMTTSFAPSSTFVAGTTISLYGIAS